MGQRRGQIWIRLEQSLLQVVQLFVLKHLPPLGLQPVHRLRGVPLACRFFVMLRQRNLRRLVGGRQRTTLQR